MSIQNFANNERKSNHERQPFDTRITALDIVKILLLVVTCFSTYNIISLITPQGAFSWVREFAAIGVIEGAFLGFEFATRDSKNKSQMQYATIGFFLSLTVIALFAGVSGLVEFGGESLLKQAAGQFMGIDWAVRDWVMLTALMITVCWIFALAGIYRLYSLADPDKEAELNRNQTYGSMKKASNDALREAMKQAQPTISIQRALAQIRNDYQTELTPAQLETLLHEVEKHLKTSVHGVGESTPILTAPKNSNHGGALLPLWGGVPWLTAPKQNAEPMNFETVGPGTLENVEGGEPPAVPFDGQPGQ